MSCCKWEKGSLDQVGMPNPAPIINVTCSQLPHSCCSINTLGFFWKLVVIDNFNYIHFGFGKNYFVLVHLHRHWQECHPKRVPDTFPCLLERQLSEDGVRIFLHISNSWQCSLFASSSKDMYAPNLMCRGGNNKGSGWSAHDCSANSNNSFNGVMLVCHGWSFLSLFSKYIWNIVAVVNS